jgi:hypothetical protein
LCLFCVSIGSGLAMGWSPVQGVLPTLLGLRNWGESKRFTDVLCSKAGETGKRERLSCSCEAFRNIDVQRLSFYRLLPRNLSTVLGAKRVSPPRGRLAECSLDRKLGRFHSIDVLPQQLAKCPDVNPWHREAL